MRRTIWSLLVGISAMTGTAATAAAQVNFNGSAFVCFDDAFSNCNPDPNILGGFGGSWSRVNPAPQLLFNGFTFNVTTSATTGEVAINAGDAHFLNGSFSGEFHLAMLFLNAPVPATTLVFSGNATTVGNQLFIDFVPNIKTGTYGVGNNFFFGELNDFVLTRGAAAPTTITGKLCVNPLTTVPEPSTYLMLSVGLAMLAAFTRQRSRRGA